jgi:prepilin-type N-terminal cleavage/methylation domain-containing protein
MKMKKAFTLIELMVAVALLAMVLSFSGVIFKVSINSHRTSGANTDVMQKLRAVTDQLNTDFRKLPKDAYLILHCEEQSRSEYEDSIATDIFRADRIYYFCTGDFQSWYDEGVKASIARVYFGHDGISLFDLIRNEPVSRWNLARDLMLLTPGQTIPAPPPFVDYNDISYAACVANPPSILADSDRLLSPPPTGLPPVINIRNDANNVRRLMCENVGEIKIEWSDGTRYPALNPNLENSLVWFSGLRTRKDGDLSNGIIGDSAYDGTVEFESAGPPAFYRAIWTPLTPKQYWPKALKFTFTLYDSRGILEKGRTFTHIVYLEN